MGAALEQLVVGQHNPVQYATLENTQITFSTVSIEILTEIKIIRPHEVVSNTQFVNGLKRLDNDLQESEDNNKRRYELANDATIGVSLSATAGIIARALRGGVLLSSVIASTPLWSSIDPIRVLSSHNRERDETQADNEVEEYFNDK